MSKKTYISMDDSNKVSKKVILNNEQNEVCGTLKTTDASDNKIKDINEIFVTKSDLQKIQQAMVEAFSAISEINTDEDDEDGGNYNLKDLAEKLNKIISTIKGEEHE